MSGNFLTFDLTIKFVLLHALLAVSMPNIRLVQRADLADFTWHGRFSICQ